MPGRRASRSRFFLLFYCLDCLPHSILTHSPSHTSQPRQKAVCMLSRCPPSHCVQLCFSAVRRNEVQISRLCSGVRRIFLAHRECHRTTFRRRKVAHSQFHLLYPASQRNDTLAFLLVVRQSTRWVNPPSSILDRSKPDELFSE